MRFMKYINKRHIVFGIIGLCLGTVILSFAGAVLGLVFGISIAEITYMIDMVKND